ncbi:SpaA isopeptide-forming pilin-related protein [Streptomyces sp. NPDC012510]|uniref:SpaA isopeptide-forming pilin-related protein n=1 Tax=Streptomyces sp. NPDC012510 TaxID=3364838 RepID=UPI0036EA3C99
MHTRSARRLPATAVTIAAVASTVSLAPAAVAQTPEPTPSTSAVPLSAAETGGVTILKKDPGGDVLTGASFTLLDSQGQLSASGETNADGQLAFENLPPGVYRLKEVSSGSPLHDVVDDQDVIVTPGANTPLTIIDPFKPATVTLKASDSKSGKLLPGSTVNIGTGDTTILTLTTGAGGTASAKLLVNSRTGTTFWVKPTKAPAGYELYEPSKSFTAKPGSPVTVTITNTKTTSTTPAPSSSERPSDRPTIDESTSGKPTPDQGDSTSTSPSDTAVVAKTATSTAAPAPKGTLAHTGAEATPWLLGGAGVLLAVGGGAVFVARRRRVDDDSGGPSLG